MVVLILGGLIAYRQVTRPQGLSDEQQIKRLLTEAEEAVESKNVKRCMALVSSDYKDPYGFTKGALRLEAIRAFQSVEGLDVIFREVRVQLEGHEARVEAVVLVDEIEDSRRARVLETNLALIFRKEKVRHWLIFRSVEWRVVSAWGFQDGLSDDGMGLHFGKA